MLSKEALTTCDSRHERAEDKHGQGQKKDVWHLQKNAPKGFQPDSSSIACEVNRAFTHSTRYKRTMVDERVVTLLRLPRSGHQIIGVLAGAIEEVVLNVAHNGVKTVLEETFVRSLSGSGNKA